MHQDKHCRVCDCNWYNGYIEYDISHINPEWDYLVQLYEIRSMVDGKNVHHSDFQLFIKGQEAPVSLAKYPRAQKKALWEVIFKVKRYYFDTYKPDVVQHTIKQDFSVSKRYDIYKNNLYFPEYEVKHDKWNIWYIRKDRDDDNDEGPFGNTPKGFFNTRFMS